MNSSEQDFFDNLRQSIQSGRTAGEISLPPSQYKETYPPAALLQKISHRSPEQQRQLMAEFQENSAPLNLQTWTADSLETASDIVVELIRSREPEFSHNKHVMLHDHPDLAAMKLWKRLNREAVTIHTSFHPDKQIREKTISSYIGITVPEIGIAESATVVEVRQQGQPRSTSLVPSIHIAVIRRQRLVATLAEAYALLKKKTVPGDVIFISGPSKTADIEAQLVHGAHGPKEMHVIIISQENEQS